LAAGLHPDPLQREFMGSSRPPSRNGKPTSKGRKRRGSTYKGRERRDLLLRGMDVKGGEGTEREGKGIPPPKVKVSRIKHCGQL